MTSSSQSLRPFVDGSPIVIVRSEKMVGHLPAPSRLPTTGRPITLAEYVDAHGSAPPWPTLCGKKGDVWIYGAIFVARSACPKCVAALAKVAA